MASDVPETELAAAAQAIRDGELVVYPTETVYGLGAAATDKASIGRVFDAKGRSRDDPLSMAVPSVKAAERYIERSRRTRAFMEAFLPGPVTVVCTKGDVVPDALTGGRDRVGVRVPDHETALGLLDRVAPITATSANRSGRRSVRRAEDLDPEIESAVAAVLDGGETPGTESTVVDPERGEVIRRGARAEAVQAWLDER